MIVFEGRPAQYRGTIEVYAIEGLPADNSWVNGNFIPEWRWRCRSRNNTILASGEGYRRRAGALNAIERLFAWASSPDIPGIENGIEVRDYVTPWRLVIRDRHGDIDKIGAVY